MKPLSAPLSNLCHLHTTSVTASGQLDSLVWNSVPQSSKVFHKRLMIHETEGVALGSPIEKSVSSALHHQ